MNKKYKIVRVIKKTYIVVVHGIRIKAVNVENKEAIRRKI